jgi:hypothetical protein
MRVYETKEVACPCCKHDCTATSLIERKICDVCEDDWPVASLGMDDEPMFEACQFCLDTRRDEFPEQIQLMYKK